MARVRAPQSNRPPGRRAQAPQPPYTAREQVPLSPRTAPGMGDLRVTERQPVRGPTTNPLGRAAQNQIAIANMQGVQNRQMPDYRDQIAMREAYRQNQIALAAERARQNQMFARGRTPSLDQQRAYGYTFPTPGMGDVQQRGNYQVAFSNYLDRYDRVADPYTQGLQYYRSLTSNPAQQIITEYDRRLANQRRYDQGVQYYQSLVAPLPIPPNIPLPPPPTGGGGYGDWGGGGGGGGYSEPEPEWYETMLNWKY